MRSKLLSLIESEGLSRRASDLLALAKPSITLQPRSTIDGQLPVGVSKFGGGPDLPPSVEWPTWNGDPLAFIAQIHMAEATRYDAAHVLPQSGWLSFFYETDESVWGYDPAHRGAWRVLHFGGSESNLIRRFTPFFRSDDQMARPDLQFPEHAIDFSEGICLPPTESSAITSLNLAKSERAAYYKLLQGVAQLNHGHAGRHRLLGHPDQIQGDMQLKCQLVSHGLYCGDSSGYRDPRRATLESGAKDWQLLLQVDSGDDVSMIWGDSGRIYYWIYKDDLEARRFENIWFALQCY